VMDSFAKFLREIDLFMFGIVIINLFLKI